jgi:hypothetical protein
VGAAFLRPHFGMDSHPVKERLLEELQAENRRLCRSLGEDIAKQIIGKVGFAKEALVHVSWGSSGPPFGELAHEIKDGKGGKTITFFVLEPKVNQRGMAYRLGNDFFAVPKNSSVQFGKSR